MVQCFNILFPHSILNIFQIYAHVKILWFSFFILALIVYSQTGLLKQGKDLKIVSLFCFPLFILPS